ncbi:MAG: hypothetical protein A2087_02285 [Spirochaetes bacterium GWD1_61_31]|nr:MAG: hypothetical protein A2Y37_00705 [Spirochaetes bacterium GWB1_60_80]OHD29478.1 MAG: hypothetical protein A2004_03750 [Spirochaetes bacterium GWC1_61_12]OHD43998.1 MAG: hypothetical protein A2087_02285 [Spirochaetes bacterium GWD1_61_31]OHD46190.1 MAG: hypothetical protein A2Y35_00820 [Spirochaetes bacterium GWE1_60_18]OHD60728.1 MAG: hypothetical protein A2Y32_07625 [Spirochaetes bacterium GWF1_60_12]HAP43881.1 hypothetical protein [Spirochaetaceae bacterium]
MNMDLFHRFFQHVTSEIAALDYFVEQQRGMSGAIRQRTWPQLERAMQQANLAATMVAEAEAGRCRLWQDLLQELKLPANSDSTSVCAAVPSAYRSLVTGACRGLRGATSRAKLENEALRAFSGGMADNLAKVINELFPDKRGTIYGKTGSKRVAGQAPIVLDTAF